jgi:hypothetical protein
MLKGELTYSHGRAGAMGTPQGQAQYLHRGDAPQIYVSEEKERQKLDQHWKEGSKECKSKAAFTTREVCCQSLAHRGRR